MRNLLVLLFIVYCIHLLSELDPSIKHTVNKLQDTVTEDVQNLGQTVAGTVGVEVENPTKIWRERRRKFRYVNGDPLLHYSIQVGDKIDGSYNYGCVGQEVVDLWYNRLKEILDSYAMNYEFAPGNLRYKYIVEMNDNTLLALEDEVGQLSNEIEDRCADIIAMRKEERKAAQLEARRRMMH